MEASPGRRGKFLSRDPNASPRHGEQGWACCMGVSRALSGAWGSRSAAPGGPRWLCTVVGHPQRQQQRPWWPAWPRLDKSHEHDAELGLSVAGSREA